MSQYQVLARRWRPITFDAVVGQEPIVRTLQNALARQRIAHAYLFTGPRGVGKTTTARLLAMGLNCERAGGSHPVPCAACEMCREIIAGRALDVIEIDGASNRGIDEVRTLRENTRYAPARGRWKVYIIDEVHMLTEPAFNALLKTLEEPPAHVVFVLATTEPRELPATILSRCQRFDFRPIALGEIAAGLRRILDEEGARSGETLAVEADAFTQIAAAADGSLRDALSLLDTALAYGEGRVTAPMVRALLGSSGAEAAWGLATALARRDARDALARLERAAADGDDVGLLGQDAMEVLRRALLVAVHGEAPPGVTGEEAARLRELGAAGTEDLLLLVKGLVDAEAEMRKSPHPRVDLEVAVVRLCHRPHPQAIESVLARLEQAEAHLRGFGPGSAEPAGPHQTDLLDQAGGPALAGGVTPAAARPAAPPSRRIPPAPAGARPPLPERPAAPPAAEEPGQALWARIVAEMTRVRPTLGHLLAEAVLVSDEEGRLTVAVPNGNAFTQDQVRNRDNRQFVLDAARRVRPDVREVVFTTGTIPGGPGAAADHPVVRAAVELFEGEVTAVRPARGSAASGRGESGNAAPERGEGT
ncbi:MAG TPA: DNA polymerase III subunit gamma/tau [Methylomirabilota bacterium]|jgi:DNA polymerase-3 subunit gamma/tau|nr:DNA polymerase III subunit gamma/tau [Methylomirabilota bacterium]